MAKPYDSGSSSEGTPSNGSIASEEEARNGAEANIEEEIDEEELEAVARTAGPDDDEAKDDSGEEDAREDEDDGDEDGEEVRFGLVACALDSDRCHRGVSHYYGPENSEIGKRERARLREMQRKKKQKIQEMLNTQNAAIDADMNNKGKGRLKYLLQQTEIFAHFAKGAQSASEKKPRGR
ncbi:hypothetical protein ZIOFF_056381 [Zingiber officinale]|uniref:Uncharacterized protein n=1 Tax=Zingiber officinale TaxID=94328 RepID=A0A8J5FNR3_ZINOF|nr:hypothetical protein ZIOFF_056381 [Zingiber officinale]